MVAIIRFLFDILESIIVGVLDAGYGGLASLFSKERKKEYDADFMSRSDQAKILNKANMGLVLDGIRSLSVDNSTKNVIVSGKTGNFKTSGILLPNIYKLRNVGSMVILDPPAECLLKGSGSILAAGGKVAVLNYSTPHASHGYNPIKWCGKDKSELRKLCKMLTSTSLGANPKDPFWNLSTENLLSVLLVYIVFYTSEEYHTLYQLYWLLNRFSYDPQSIERLLIYSGDELLLNEYKPLLTFGDKMLSSIVACALSVLAIFGQDPDVALVTSHHTLDLKMFKKERVALFINTSTRDIKYYSAINSVMLNQLFGEIMSELPSEKDLPIFFLIDEASSLTFGNLQLICSNLRKFNSSLLQIYQSAPAQLTELYGASAARAIMENNFARVFMPGQSNAVAQELEQSFGKFEYRENDGSGPRIVRPLMTAADIQLCKDCLITTNGRPIRAAITPYFKQSKLLTLSQLPPYEQADLLPFDTPPLLKID